MRDQTFMRGMAHPRSDFSLTAAPALLCLRSNDIFARSLRAVVATAKRHRALINQVRFGKLCYMVGVGYHQIHVRPMRAVQRHDYRWQRPQFAKPIVFTARAAAPQYFLFAVALAVRPEYPLYVYIATLSDQNDATGDSVTKLVTRCEFINP